MVTLRCKIVTYLRENVVYVTCLTLRKFSLPKNLHNPYLSYRTFLGLIFTLALNDNISIFIYYVNCKCECVYTIQVLLCHHL